MRAVLFWFAIALMLFAFLFPVFWVYLTSLKQPEDIFGAGLIFEPTFYNYRYLVEVRPSLNGTS